MTSAKSPRATLSARTTMAAGDVPVPAAKAPSNVRPIDPAELARIFGGPVDLIDLYRAGCREPTFAERLVEFMRRNGDRALFALTFFALGSLFTCGAAYVIRWAVLR